MMVIDPFENFQRRQQTDVVFDSNCSTENGSTELYTSQGGWTSLRIDIE